jgi:hypothetical protein
MRADKFKFPHVLIPPLDSGPIKIVPDEELHRLADEAGPSSTAASMLRELQASRAKDRLSTPERNCIGGPGQKSIGTACKKAPDIGGLLAFAVNPEVVLRV